VSNNEAAVNTLRVPSSWNHSRELATLVNQENHTTPESGALLVGKKGFQNGMGFTG